jgi:predicted DNA-binding WGR domain protein
MSNQSATTILRNTSNSHHKEYQVTVESNADGTANLSFAYGRIGSSLTEGYKLKAVTTEKAIAAANKLIAEKAAKGYVLASGAAQQHTHQAQVEIPQVARRHSKKAALAQANAVLSGLTSGRRKGLSIAL